MATGGARKPWVAVLGGCGFIGRNLVELLITNDLVSYVRVIDKVPPQTAWLNCHHDAVFSSPLIEFQSANLINPASCASALVPPEGQETWDLVVNCAGETKPGQTDPVYREGILNLSLNCAKECMKLRVKRYIEISSGYLYSSEKTPHKEDGPIEPWTTEAKWKSQVESELTKLKPDFKFTVVRPAVVYGLGDRRSLTTRLLVGAIYKQLGEMMKLLWTPDLKLNTVHVTDLSRAIWFLYTKPEAEGEIYNVVDKGNSTQGRITEIISEIFNINHDYWGTAMSTLANADLTSVVDEANDKHLCAWANACSAEQIVNTPLDPTTRPELLLNKHVNLDGEKIEKLGFTYEVDTPTVEKLKEVIEDFAEMKVFPRSLLL